MLIILLLMIIILLIPILLIILMMITLIMLTVISTLIYACMVLTLQSSWPGIIRRGTSYRVGSYRKIPGKGKALIKGNPPQLLPSFSPACPWFVAPGARCKRGYRPSMYNLLYSLSLSLYIYIYIYIHNTIIHYNIIWYIIICYTYNIMIAQWRHMI